MASEESTPGTSPNTTSGTVLPQFLLANPEPAFQLDVTTESAAGIYREGEQLVVNVKPERKARVYLIYHQVDGKSLLLFPNQARADNKLAAGQAVKLPSAGERYRWPVRAPFGTDVLQVVASNEPIAELDSLVKSDVRQPEVPSAQLTAINERLNKSRGTWVEKRIKVRTFARDAVAEGRVGIFIGVGKSRRSELYPAHEEFSQSAAAVCQAMLADGALDPARTRLVQDEKATRHELEEVFVKWLPEATHAGDTIFIYFAGYEVPSPAQDPGRAAANSLNLVPFDVDLGKSDETVSFDQWLKRYDQSVVTHARLHTWLEKFADRQVVLICDTCRPPAEGLAAFSVQANAPASQPAAGPAATSADLTIWSTSDYDPKFFEGTSLKRLWFSRSLIEAIVHPGPRPLTLKTAFDLASEQWQTLLPKDHPARKYAPLLSNPDKASVVLVP